MKRSVTLFLLTIVLLTGKMWSQVAVPTTANECMQTAIDTAKNILVGSELMAIGTVTIKKAPVIGDITFNLATGKSELWIYQFRSKIDGTPAVLGVFKSSLTQTCLALQINDADTSKVPFTPIKDGWKNSPEVNAQFMKNGLYVLYRGQFPDSTIAALNVVTSDALDDESPFPLNTTLWFGIMNISATEHLACAFDALTGDTTICAKIQDPVTSAQDDPVARMQPQIYSNPVRDIAMLNIPFATQETVREVSVYDIQGNLVLNGNALIRTMTQGTMLLPVKSLSPALYMVRVVTNEKAFTVPMIIER